MKLSWTQNLTKYSRIASLLEFKHGKLVQSNIHDKTYCVVAMEAAIIAGQRTAGTGLRHGRVHNKYWMNMTRRERLRIPEAEEIICLGRFTPDLTTENNQ